MLKTIPQINLHGSACCASRDSCKGFPRCPVYPVLDRCFYALLCWVMHLPCTQANEASWQPPACFLPWTRCRSTLSMSLFSFLKTYGSIGPRVRFLLSPIPLTICESSAYFKALRNTVRTSTTQYPCSYLRGLIYFLCFSLYIFFSMTNNTASPHLPPKRVGEHSYTHTQLHSIASMSTMYPLPPQYIACIRSRSRLPLPPCGI